MAEPPVDNDPLLSDDELRARREVLSPTGLGASFRRRCLELLFVLSLAFLPHIAVNLIGPFIHSEFLRLTDSRGIPIPDEIALGQCANWTKSSSGVESVQFHIDASALQFISQGSLSTGEIVVTQSMVPTPTNKAKITVSLKLDNPKLVDYVRVCEIRHRYSEHLGSGVGIFSVPWLPPLRSWFLVSVELPRPANDALNVESFSSQMPSFLHRFRGIGDVHFERLTVSTSDRPVFAHSLFGEKIIISTTNAPIQGSFNVTSFLELTTSNSPIEVDLGLHDLSPPRYSTCDSVNQNRWEYHWPVGYPSVELYNSKGPIRATANLTRRFDPATIHRESHRYHSDEDEDDQCRSHPTKQWTPNTSHSTELPLTLEDPTRIEHTGGRYALTAKTTRSSISIEFDTDPPVNHSLTVDASTYFGGINVGVPVTYEGYWKVKALSAYREVVHGNCANCTDPSGEKRERVLRVDRRNAVWEEGVVYWGRKEDSVEERLDGWVEVNSMFGRTAIIV